MNDIKVKICGVKSAAIAECCIHEGADYIGLVFYQKSPRNVTLNAASEICHVARGSTAEPVAVFVDSSLDEIVQICNRLGINHVQLHGDVSRYSKDELPSYLNIIYAYSFSDERMTYADLRSDNDFLLIDSQRAGSGEAWNWEKLKHRPDQRFFLAGGLSKDTVKAAIAITRPYGVDVSSGVESSIGHKCEHQIKAFIHAVREG